MKDSKRNKPVGTKRLTLMAVFIAIALALYSLEAVLPPVIPVPGVKLGLANIITLIVIRRMSVKEAGVVLILRIILAAILTGQGVSFIYSMCGGLCCLLAQSVINTFLKGRAVVLTSIFGALFHNLGQILAAAFILRLSGIFVYIPYLVISGCIMGLFTGLVVMFTDKNIPINIEEM